MQKIVLDETKIKSLLSFVIHKVNTASVQTSMQMMLVTIKTEMGLTVNFKKIFLSERFNAGRHFCVMAVAAELVFMCAAPSFALPALEELERKSGDGPQVLEALAASARDSYLEQLEGQRAGGKWFLNGSIGYSDEPQYETSDNSIHYTKLSVSAGLSFPLFGTWDKLKINRLNAELRAADSKYRVQILRTQNLSALRKAYAILWVESQKIKLAQAFLSDREHVAAYLSNRKGKSLLLPSDYLEFLAGYEMAKKDIAVSTLHMVQAMRIIRMDTGENWPMPAAVAMPTLPSLKDVSADVDANPSVIAKRESIKKYEKLANVSRWIDNEGQVNFGLSAGKAIPGDFGTGIYASVALSGPLKEIGREDKARLAAKSNLDRAKYEENYTAMGIEGEAEEAVAMAAYASANIGAQYARLKSIAETVRENYVRHGTIAGDTFERLQRSRYQYYRVAMDMLDSQLIMLQSGADILAAAYPQGHESEPRMRESVTDGRFINSVISQKWFVSSEKLSPYVRAAAAQNTEYIMPEYTYVWNAEPLLDTQRRDSSVAELHASGITNIFISFTARQLALIKTPEGAQKLDELLKSASESGIKCELTLADPMWLLPEHRHEMVSVIKAMSRFKFSGIHLDLEPDQIAGAAQMRGKLAGMLADSVKEAGKNTPLPVSFSVHPRYLEGSLGTALDKGLNGAKVSCIVPMIYTSDAAAAASGLAAIMASHPKYRFILAQSVERELPQTESYFSSGLPGFKKSISLIETKLGSKPGFKGIAVQSWEDYKRLEQ